jgi:hypothetical protein
MKVEGPTDAAPTDAALDAEIRHALAVDPSPAFQARVRARIAGERPERALRGLWAYCSLAAIGAVVSIVAFASWPAARTPRPAASTRLAAHASIGFAPPISSGAGTRPLFPAAEAARGDRRLSTAETGHLAAAESEVLLAPDETRALHALIAGVRDGRIDLRPVATAAPPPDVMDLAPIEPLAIPPIVIAPVEGVQP